MNDPVQDIPHDTCFNFYSLKLTAQLPLAEFQTWGGG